MNLLDVSEQGSVGGLLDDNGVPTPESGQSKTVVLYPPPPTTDIFGTESETETEAPLLGLVVMTEGSTVSINTASLIDAPPAIGSDEFNALPVPSEPGFFRSFWELFLIRLVYDMNSN